METLTAKHKPYTTYKPSGVEWLDEIPAHWEVAAVKRHFSIQLGKMLQNTPNSPADIEVPYLKAQHVQWFQVLTADVPTMWANQNEKHKFGIRPGDLLVCEGGEGGRSAIVRQQIDNCIIQNALHRVRPSGQSLNAFLQYVMSTVTAVGWFDVLNDKATIAHFTKEKFDALKIPSPPLAEQVAIAAFLERETRKIDALISKKERLIALLQEKRTALISHTVTKGLDAHAPLKDSGVEWLGEIPAHWEVRRLKTLCSMKSGDSINVMSIESTGEYAVYGGNGKRGYTSNYNHDGAFVLIGRQGAYCGNVHIARGRFWATEHAVVATHDPSHNVVWFGAILTAMNLNQYSIAAAQPGLAIERIMDLRLPVPSLPEQRAIAAFLDRETAKLDNLIAKVHNAIELLKELRAALISAAVTGRIDVREETECT